MALSLVACGKDEGGRDVEDKPTNSAGSDVKNTENVPENTDKVEPSEEPGGRNEPAETQEPEESKAPVESKSPTKPAQTGGNLPSGENWKATYMKTYLYRDSFDDVCLVAVIAIENTSNEVLYVDDAVLELQDTAGNVLYDYNLASTVPLFIEAGETGYIYTDGATVEGVSENDEYVLVPKIDLVPAEETPIRYEVSDITVDNKSYIYDVQFSFKMTKSAADDNTFARCVAVMFDKDGDVIGITSESIYEIESVGVYDAKIDGFFLGDPNTNTYTVDDIDSYVVFAFPLQFNW